MLMAEVKSLNVKCIQKELIEDEAIVGKASFVRRHQNDLYSWKGNLLQLRMIVSSYSPGGSMLNVKFTHAKVKYDAMESRESPSNRGLRAEELIVTE